MGSCNGHSNKIDIEDAKKATLESALKSVEVAKNQQLDLLQKFKEVYSYFEPESYDSQDHWFLEVPEEASDLKTLTDHLKRFSVAMDQILLEESPDYYRKSCIYAKYQISQLTEYLQQLAILMNGNEAVDDIYPSLPVDLNTEDSPSARQTRDYLVIRDYRRLLDLIQNVLTNYE
ncbi:uncharacterized protein [Parasteatoda tepidariorum]|uniref:uncharacterized protein n=1 Tax=Parasteatoda tepidariorum TaxID=114398 RepID=UPI00077FBF4A|nr:uncharacterized protein LOC107449588 [Parasteatoda tepidariorum]XP_042903633.1 uncharacterized protein LOC107449588 [Parasteatoda tepidariorum]XP_042903634.1 uncharacterized protein LOC107449588 [Parasteatoda tepidariorum]XP_042903635.1 uncharacterized protein LOC107449588 [Parasteatoda tepidariorum]XP_042903636.1 uncharacterized protein LOC107449588 [Parasteatoda tepidariorum]